MKNIIILIFLIFSYQGFSQILPTSHGVHHKKSSSGGSGCVGSGCVGSGSETRTFTNCSKTGREGPSQSDCNTAYASNDLNGEVSVSNGIQTWIVPANATYTITAYGAQGGGPHGGLGAKTCGQFTLNAGDVIKILVGQKGNYLQTDASGGGGTFVTKSPHNNNSSILVVAGGGGGSFVDNSTSNGQCTTAGADGCCSQSNFSTSGGTDGNGGGSTSNASLIGGAGFLTNGIGYQGTMSQSYLNGGVGANNEWSGDTGFGGGFGGGGDANRKHASTYATAGGGGYSGGGFGYYFSNNTPTSGGGGGSYNNGSNTSNTAGNNSGHGKVTINW